MLSNQEFNDIMKLEKIFTDKKIVLPSTGSRKDFALCSTTTNEIFSLSVNRASTFELNKCSINKSFQKIPIIRVEIDSPPHLNPDKTKTGRDHIHIYKEGWGLSWAFDLKDFDKSLFKTTSFINAFYDFCKYCNIKINQDIQGAI